MIQLERRARAIREHLAPGEPCIPSKVGHRLFGTSDRLSKHTNSRPYGHTFNEWDSTFRRVQRLTGLDDIGLTSRQDRVGEIAHLGMSRMGTLDHALL